MTTGSPPLRFWMAGIVRRRRGAGVGFARLVDVSRVKVVDMAAISSGCVHQRKGTDLCAKAASPPSVRVGPKRILKRTSNSNSGGVYALQLCEPLPGWVISTVFPV